MKVSVIASVTIYSFALAAPAGTNNGRTAVTGSIDFDKNGDAVGSINFGGDGGVKGNGDGKGSIKLGGDGDLKGKGGGAGGLDIGDLVAGVLASLGLGGNGGGKGGAGGNGGITGGLPIVGGGGGGGKGGLPVDVGGLTGGLPIVGGGGGGKGGITGGLPVVGGDKGGKGGKGGSGGLGLDGVLGTVTGVLGGGGKGGGPLGAVGGVTGGLGGGKGGAGGNSGGGPLGLNAITGVLSGSREGFFAFRKAADLLSEGACNLALTEATHVADFFVLAPFQAVQELLTGWYETGEAAFLNTAAENGLTEVEVREVSEKFATTQDVFNFFEDADKTLSKNGGKGTFEGVQPKEFIGSSAYRRCRQLQSTDGIRFVELGDETPKDVRPVRPGGPVKADGVVPVVPVRVNGATARVDPTKKEATEGTEEPAPEAPVTEEPAPEAPVTEETKEDEPKPEEPKPEEPKPEEPKPEEPKSEEPKPEEPKEDKAATKA
ncbi:hypothetical protein TWF718_008110 [Orbilia javanica]|uniref:Uncharacterized protein n=1 Tax=Orbilia javanica TaxID=47235 RepID=A0AAN8N0H9_9PEZI